MDDYKLYGIVRSKCGRDAGRYYVITARDGEYLMLCDGRHRKLMNPKRKKIKHVTNEDAQEILVKLTDSEIRAMIEQHLSRNEGGN